MTLLLTILGVLVVVLAVALAYDLRARRRGRIASGHDLGTAARQTKLDGQYRATKWGAGT